MLWFKNLMVYRLSRDIELRAEEMEKQLVEGHLPLYEPQIWRKPVGCRRWDRTATR